MKKLGHVEWRIALKGIFRPGILLLKLVLDTTLETQRKVGHNSFISTNDVRDNAKGENIKGIEKNCWIISREKNTRPL